MRSRDSGYRDTIRNDRSACQRTDRLRPGSLVTTSDAPEVAEPKPMRADARRNRQRILDAAAATFASDGIGVPVDVVAERAGVGIGTLYRHFPTKEALFEAIVVDRIDTLLASAAAPCSGDDASEALFSFLARMAAEVSSKHDLSDALGQAGFDLKAKCAVKFDQLRAAIEALRTRAVAQGGVRGDVTTDQVIDLVVGVCKGTGTSGGTALGSPGPLVQVVCDGLRRRP
jgi:AcrR family transcriptional regulator